jgi:hypothetical protein
MCFRGSEGHAPRLCRSECDIEANSEKISVITDIRPIRNVKGVQWVTSCLAALSHFIARLGEQSLHLYQLLKKSEHFTWTLEAQGALESLKRLLKNPLVLNALSDHGFPTVNFKILPYTHHCYLNIKLFHPLL